jgi:hypothetical protein
MSGHDEPVLHEAEEKETEEESCPMGIDFEEPEIGGDEEVGGEDMRGGMEISLVLSKEGDLLPQFDITL